MVMTVNAEYFNLNLAPAVRAFSVFAVSQRGLFYGRGGEMALSVVVRVSSTGKLAMLPYPLRPPFFLSLERRI